jgi:sugar lactone lactonase YvrE
MTGPAPATVDWSPVLSGLAFAEAPRWHDGKLYLSDIFGQAVWRVAADGDAEIILEVPARPSGLGWDPDGHMLVVSMRDRRLLRVVDGVAHDAADLSRVTDYDCNDMGVDRLGRAYIGNFGYDYNGGEERKPTGLLFVDGDGTPRIVAEDVWFPNGIVISPDGTTLHVAETSANRVTTFTIDDDGSLHDRRLFAQFEETRPDGMCLDAEGALWISSPGPGELLRVLPGGTITHSLAPPLGTAQSCVLGGADGRSLFVCSTPIHIEADCLRERTGRVSVTQVEVPAAD